MRSITCESPSRVSRFAGRARWSDVRTEARLFRQTGVGSSMKLARVEFVSVPREVLSMSLVWVTGTSGVGKSTVCVLLKSRGALAVDADWEGYSHWVDRISGQIVADPPYPVPGGWLERFAWRISRAEIETLSTRTHDKTAFLCGSAENEAVVWDMFDHMICLVVNNETLRDRLGME